MNLPRQGHTVLMAGRRQNSSHTVPRPGRVCPLYGKNACRSCSSREISPGKRELVWGVHLGTTAGEPRQPSKARGGFCSPVQSQGGSPGSTASGELHSLWPWDSDLCLHTPGSRLTVPPHWPQTLHGPFAHSTKVGASRPSSEMLQHLACLYFRFLIHTLYWKS